MDIYNVSMKSVSKADEGSIHAQITISFKLTCFNNRAMFQQSLPLNENS